MHQILGFDLLKHSRRYQLIDTHDRHHWYLCTAPRKRFIFLSVSNGPTSILLDISITLRKWHKTTFVGYFWKMINTCEKCFWDSQICCGIDTFLRFVRDVLKTYTKSIFLEMFLRGLWNVSLNWDLSETSHAGWDNNLPKL